MLRQPLALSCCACLGGFHKASSGKGASACCLRSSQAIGQPLVSPDQKPHVRLSVETGLHATHATAGRRSCRHRSTAAKPGRASPCKMLQPAHCWHAFTASACLQVTGGTAGIVGTTEGTAGTAAGVGDTKTAATATGSTSTGADKAVCCCALLQAKHLQMDAR